MVANLVMFQLSLSICTSSVPARSRGTRVSPPACLPQHQAPPAPLTLNGHVGKRLVVRGVDQRDREVGFHGRLIKAGEGFPRIGCLHLCGGHDPARKPCQHPSAWGLCPLCTLQGAGVPPLTPQPARSGWHAEAPCAHGA